MAKQVHFWIDRCAEMEEQRDEWIEIARRLVNPFHDANCEYGAPCAYCVAVARVQSVG